MASSSSHAKGNDVPSVDFSRDDDNDDDTNTDTDTEGGLGDLGRESDVVPKDVSNSASSATEDTCTADSTSESCEISTDDDDGISQSTPIARPNLSKTRPTCTRLPTKTSKTACAKKNATAVVASSSRGAAVPADRFVTEEATSQVSRELPPLEILQHDDGDGVSLVTNPDHWTVGSGSTGGSSYLDAYFQIDRPVTPPRTQRGAGRRMIEVPAESDGSMPADFRVTIPGAYAVFPNDTESADGALAPGRRLPDQTLPTSNINSGFGTGTGTERPTQQDEAVVDSLSDSMSDPLDPVYRLTEAAVVDDDVIVEARPVDEEVDSDVVAQLERQYSLAMEEARVKGRRQREIFWVVLIAVVLAVVVSATVAITTKTGATIDESVPGGGNTNSEADHHHDDLPSAMLSLRNIVGGSSPGFADDSNRMAALDWMSKDQISMSLLQSSRGVGELEGEVALKLRQRYVSALIFLATNGPHWYARLGFLSTKDECDWNRAILGDASAGEVTGFGGAVEAKGLFCNEEGRIQRISLWWNGLSGTLPSEMSFLSDSLEGINLTGGSISGTVPSSFGNLAKLKELSLSEHCLTGALPGSLSSLNRLEIVNLHGNDNLSGSLNALCKNDVAAWFAADCGDCPGSEERIQCDCCVCCESSSFTCCDKEGEMLFRWMNLAANPITHLPHSFDRPCLSKETIEWKEEECPCVVYEKSGGGICSTECDDKTLLHNTLDQASNGFP